MEQKYLITKEQAQEHIERVEWNEKTAKILGMRIKKMTDPILEISIYQGEISLYHAVMMKDSPLGKYKLHEGLEEFLQRWVKMLNSNVIRTDQITFRKSNR